MKGFADHELGRIARPGEVAAIYMGKKIRALSSKAAC